MPKLIIVVMVMLVIFTCAWAKDLVIKRENCVLRAGPATYQKVLCALPLNSKVSEIRVLEGWLEVSYQEINGFIPKSATQPKTLKSDPFAKVTSSTAGSGVSKHSITAGVKGFAQSFDSQFELIGDAAFYDLALGYATDPSAFNAFERETYSGADRSVYKKMCTPPANPLPDYFGTAHEGFGLAVAAVIAKQGIYDNAALTNYVNYLGQIIVQASDAGDIAFRFFILDISAPNAYACPGGYIFISKGMLQALASEAELAFVLAHEIAHVTRFHGMLETKARENQIGAELAFDELDASRPDAFSSHAQDIEQELELEIMHIFEYLVQGRLDDYEKEADQLALCFTARAGYDPQSGKNLLLRLQNSRGESNNQHYRRQSINQRLQWLDSSLRLYQKPQQKYLDHSKRFGRFKAML